MSANLGRLTMRYRWRGVSLAILTGVGVLMGSPAFAGGLLAYEIGTADVGLASAGWGARAQDVSTVFTNVAGMTRLDGDQALGGLQLLYGDISFTPSSVSGGLGADSGGNSLGWFGGAGGFYTHSLSHDLKLGIGMAGNFGAKLGYNYDWIGRYYTRNVTLIGINILPSIAYRVNEKWSVGVSLNAMPTKLKDQTAINNLVGPDGQLEYKNTAVGWGGNVGLLYEFSSATRVGFSYNSKVNLDFSDTPSFSDLGPLFRRLSAQGITSKQVDIHMNVPQQLMLSGFHQLDERVALLASAGWQEWSKFGQLEVSVETTSPHVLTPELPLKNTWHGALGAQITLDGGWTVNTGFGYDSKVQDNLFSPALPTNDAWRFGLGGETDLRKGMHWGLAVDYIYGGSPNLAKQGRPVIIGGRGSFTGNYADENFVYVASYLSFKF